MNQSRHHANYSIHGRPTLAALFSDSYLKDSTNRAAARVHMMSKRALIFVYCLVPLSGRNQYTCIAIFPSFKFQSPVWMSSRQTYPHPSRYNNLTIPGNKIVFLLDLLALIKIPHKDLLCLRKSFRLNFSDRCSLPFHCIEKEENARGKAKATSVVY